MTFPKENYRCVRKPDNKNDFGQWEYLYNGAWKDVVNFSIRAELNKLFGYWEN